MLFLLGLTVSTANAAQVSCAEVAEMVRIGVPTASIIETIKDYERTDAPEECIAGLPADVRATFEGLGSPSVAEPPRVPDFSAPMTPRSEGVSAPPATITTTQIPARCSDLQLALDARHPGTATALSASLGHGAGHFYARRPDTGALFFITQAAALGVAVGAYPVAKEDPETARTMAYAGAGALLTSWLLDVSSAGASARSETRAMLQRCGR